MPIRIFSLPFDPSTGLFNDEPLSRFLLSRKLVSMKKEFFTAEGKPYWSVFVEYDEILPPASPQLPQNLNEWQRMLLQRLKEWRKQKAEENGIPVYVIASNTELAGVVLAAPESLEMLKSVRGFGKHKVEKYGQEIIALIKGFFEKK
jgi:superfamily II DNA helicase RecQ